MEDTGNIKLETRMDTISYIIGLDYGIGIREERLKPINWPFTKV